MTVLDKKIFEKSKARLALIVGGVSIVSAAASWAGTTVTFKVTSELTDKRHDDALASHEARITSVERVQADRLARIEESQNQNSRRLDRLEEKIDRLLENRK